MTPDEQEIRQLIADWLAASKAGDAAKVLSLVTDDVVFLLPGGVMMDHDQFAAAQRAQAGADRPAIDGTSEVEELVVAGEWAFMRTKLSVTVTSSGGAPMTRAGRTLTILRKVGGAWKPARDANLLAPVEGG